MFFIQVPVQNIYITLPDLERFIMIYTTYTLLAAVPQIKKTTTMKGNAFFPLSFPPKKIILREG